MLSRFIDIDDHLYTLLKEDSILRYERELRLYEKCIAKAVKAVGKLELYPMRLLDHLFWAISCPASALELVLQEGADPNARDLDYLTPLHYVCRVSRKDKPLRGIFATLYCGVADEGKIQTLLNNRADINAQDIGGNSPLHFAISSGREDLVRALISHRCNLNISNIEGQTPLHLASTLENGKCVVLLLEAGANVDVQDQARQTPLHVAVAAKNTEYIERLMERGAKQDVLDGRNRTPLMLAVSLDYLPAVDLLYDDDRLTYITLEAVRTGAVKVVGWCMGKIDINSWPPRDIYGSIWYHEIRTNRSEVIVTILQRGRELNIKPEILLRSDDEENALHVAALYGYLLIMEVLEEYLDPEIWSKLLEQTNHEGMTPLLVSISNKHPATSSYLIDHGAHVRARTKDGWNLLHLAAWRDLDLMHKAFKMINSGKWSSHLKSMLEEEDKEGRTPRDAASSIGCSEVVKLLDEELNRLRGVGDQASDDRSNDVESGDQAQYSK
jgi:ankyrin repeat protein